MEKRFVVFLLVTLAVVGGWGGVNNETARASGAGSFSIHEEIFAADAVRVRPTASISQTALGTRKVGDLGAIIDGPISAEGYTWWKVSWSSDSMVGWSAESYLKGFERTYSSKFSIGDNVMSEKSMDVFSAPSIDFYGGLLPSYSMVTIVDGPVLSSGYTLWKVRGNMISSGGRGGVVENWAKEGAQDGMEVYLKKPSSPVRSYTQLSIGDKVAVRQDSSIDVRVFPMITLTPIATKHNGDSGVVVGGPTNADGKVWWNIRWNDNTQGWSEDNNYSYFKLRYGIGDRVRVYEERQVYLTPAFIARNPYVGADDSSPLGKRTVGDFGIVTNGPVFSSEAPLIFWWKIKWSDGVEGWSFDQYTAYSLAFRKCLTEDCSITGDGTSTSTSPGNQAPTNLMVNGPSTVTAAVSNSWTFIATDPEGKALNYKVKWGDSSSEAEATGMASGVSKSFSHAYAPSGGYTITFTATDDKGLTATKTTVVQTVQTDMPATSTPQASNKFAAGDKIKVTAPNVQVRDVFSDYTPLLGVRGVGDTGVVVGGPKSDNRYWWWQINYDTGVDGWSAGDWLEKTGSGGTITNRPPVISDFTGPASVFTREDATWTVLASDPDYDTWSYSAIWGDGTTETQNRPFSSFKHTYATAGSYTPTFTVVDSRGGLASKTVSVQVATLAPSTRFIIGDRVRNVEYSGDRGAGTVIGGPTFSNFEWSWRVNYDLGFTSWTKEVKLAKIDSINTPTSTPQVSNKFSVGDKIRVTAPSVQVRDIPTGTIIGRKNTGDLGTVVGGPKFADTYWWWQIDYVNAPDGWSAENWLEKTPMSGLEPLNYAALAIQVIQTQLDQIKAQLFAILEQLR